MWNYGWKPFFIFIGSDIILFMFVCCFVIDFCGVAATTFYIFCTLFVDHFPVEGEQLMQQYSKTRLQPSDVKTPKPVIDASMPKVMYIV